MSEIGVSNTMYATGLIVTDFFEKITRAVLTLSILKKKIVLDPE